MQEIRGIQGKQWKTGEYREIQGITEYIGIYKVGNEYIKGKLNSVDIRRKIKL